MSKRAVITGIGVISPIGTGVSDFWQNCLAGTGAVAPIPDEWAKYYNYTSKLWAPLPDIDYRAYEISRVELLQLDPSQLISLASAHLALRDAEIGYSMKDEKKNTFVVDDLAASRIGVYMGTGIGGVKSLVSDLSYHVFAPTKAQVAEASKDDNSSTECEEIVGRINIARRYNPFAVAMTMPNACSARIGIKYNATGPNNTFCSACSSGTVSIGHAFRAIKEGTVDVALTGGVEYLADDYGGIFRGFDIAGALVQNCDTPDEANRPFDQNRSGFLFAQGGGAVLVIEELSHAQARGARIYAEISGFAETFDAQSIMSVSEDGEQVSRMITDAIDEAELEANDIDYVNTHGTGTILNDEAESTVIERTFRDDVLVNATKSLTGHTIGGSGAIEAAVTALSIHHQTTHICRNLVDPIRDLNFVTAVDNHELRSGLSQSFAFGGHNAALVLQRY